ncbi:hypothetical protein CC1G_04411 [Coprinopsis cinerea okayama7|uniref:Uncharacterized protein n=1 Tax=Coprinopsis cinerea (strain Okayama-7 / 130 / ATCC MYA-4618 / FGSC 9003) TaxID=240176 RepID=A8N0J0_COPC7|nr:hypothetical protein CC1G_04411 [Coprinopsis cinerea okayama7\|eukprot:XP_001828440.1 hypothetical protein CC1G_04411 [Coprinopsis cinerea okayama7\
MQIVFKPAIGEKITVPISDCCDEQDTVILRFTATLGHQEYQQAVEGSLKVQLFSDVPSPKPEGWKAHNFEIEAALPDGTSEVARDDTRSTFIGLAEPDDQGGVHQRQLVCYVPVLVRNVRNFSFTYRIQYASGNIRWLGSYGKDGSVVIVRGGLKGLDLGQGWTDSGRVYALDATTAPVSIASFSNITDYSIWAFPRDPYDFESLEGDAELLLAIPREFGLYSAQPSYVIHASPGATMHIDSAGSLMAYGTGNVTIHACYDLSRLQSLLHLRPLQRRGQVQLQVMHENTINYLMISSHKTKTPVKIVLIPIGLQVEETLVNVGVAGLAELLGEEDLAQVAIFSPKLSDARLIQAPFTDHAVTFVVPRTGGEFILSPAHDFGTSAPGESSKGADCKISFLTPYDSISRAFEGQVTLPTPPPSPQVIPKPRNNRSQVSFAHVDEVIPQTAPKLDDPPQQTLRRRAREDNSTSSSSSSGSTPSPYRPVEGLKRGIFHGWLFIWVRYIILFFKILFRIRDKTALTVEAQIEDDIREEEDEGIEVEENSYDSDGDHARRVKLDADLRSEVIRRRLEEDPSVIPSDDRHATVTLNPQTEDVNPATIDDAKKPLIPEGKSEETDTTDTPNTSSMPNGSVQVLYAKVASPSSSPFSTTIGKNVDAAFILFVLEDAPPGGSQGEVPLSSLGKVLTVDGNIPEHLEVARLSEGTSRHEKIKDKGSIDETRWLSYLVRFSIPLRDGHAEEDTIAVDGDLRVVKIAQTA